MTEPAAADAVDPRAELAELAASVRAYVEWQADTGMDGLPIEASPDAALALLAPPAMGGRGAARRPGPPADAAAWAPPAAARPAGPPPAARVDPIAHVEPARAPVDPIATTESIARSEPARTEPAPAEPARARPTPYREGDAAEPPLPELPATPTATPASTDERRTRLALLAEEARSCTKCVLCQKRKQAVFARGNPFAELCFVGEGPGADEDAFGEPFVGRAGQLLDKMIAAMGYRRDDVYVCNVVKCRPPENRKPEPAEIAACVPFLTQQLALVKPKVIVALGASAVEGLIGASGGITRMRGKWKLYKGTTPVMPTFHPAYLLRQPDAKRDVWNDLQEVMKHLGKSPPARG